MGNLDTRYLQAIRRKVCAVCSELTPHGACGLPYGVVCPIEMYLTKIVDTVHSVSGGDIADYVDALHKKVCTLCPDQRQDGGCPFRENSTCELHRYFSLIVEAIEQVDKELNDINHIAT